LLRLLKNSPYAFYFLNNGFELCNVKDIKKLTVAF